MSVCFIRKGRRPNPTVTRQDFNEVRYRSESGDVFAVKKPLRRQAIERVAKEGLERGDKAIGVIVGDGNPDNQILRRAEVSMVSHGVAAHEEILNSSYAHGAFRSCWQIGNVNRLQS